MTRFACIRVIFDICVNQRYSISDNPRYFLLHLDCDKLWLETKEAVLTERQRIILGVIAVFALFVAGVLSFVLVQNGTIRADINPATNALKFAGSLATSSEGVTVSVDAENRDCLVKNVSSRWTVIVQNDSPDKVDEVLILKVQGMNDISIANYQPSWQTQGGYQEAAIKIGAMASGQIVTFELSGVPRSFNTALSASLSDGTGFVYTTTAGLSVAAKNSC